MVFLLYYKHCTPNFVGLALDERGILTMQRDAIKAGFGKPTDYWIGQVEPGELLMAPPAPPPPPVKLPPLPPKLPLFIEGDLRQRIKRPKAIRPN